MKNEYAILSYGSSDELEEAVNTMLEEGWTLVGGVSCSVAVSPNERQGGHDIEYMYYQAMVIKHE